MRKFLPIREYEAPTSPEETWQFLQEQGNDTRVMAGGTDLLVAMRQKGLNVRKVIDIKQVKEWNGIRQNGDGLNIGAVTSLYEIETNPVVRQRYPLLANAVGTIGSWQLRNRATLGGNIANASPAADSAPALLALSARLELVSAEGKRIVSMDEFFTGPGKSVLRKGEVLGGIILPYLAPGTQGVYCKFGSRDAMEIAIVGVAVALSLDQTGECRYARVSLGAVAPVPLRASRTESVLVGKIDERCIELAAAEAQVEAKPIDDFRASGEYRRHLVGVLVKRAIRAALAQHKVEVAKQRNGRQI